MVAIKATEVLLDIDSFARAHGPCMGGVDPAQIKLMYKHLPPEALEMLRLRYAEARKAKAEQNFLQGADAQPAATGRDGADSPPRQTRGEQSPGQRMTVMIVPLPSASQG